MLPAGSPDLYGAVPSPPASSQNFMTITTLSSPGSSSRPCGRRH